MRTGTHSPALVLTADGQRVLRKCAESAACVLCPATLSCIRLARLVMLLMHTALQPHCSMHVHVRRQHNTQLVHTHSICYLSGLVWSLFLFGRCVHLLQMTTGLHPVLGCMDGLQAIKGFKGFRTLRPSAENCRPWGLVVGRPA